MTREENKMAKKTTAEIKTINGSTHIYSADTVITFAIDKIEEFLEGDEESIQCDVVHIGEKIPEEIFSETLGSLIVELIRSRCKATGKNLLFAACELEDISKLLEKSSEKIVKESTEKDITDFKNAILKEFLC